MTSSLRIACALIPTLLVGCSPDGSAPGEVSVAAQAKPESMEQRASYSIGYNLGRTMRDQGIDVDVDLIRQGISDGFAGGDGILDAEERQTALGELQQEVQTRMSAQKDVEGSANREAGAAFLAENARKEGVMTTDTGLQYEVLEAGAGARPAATDTVTVHYRGTLIDGTEFDSSYGRGQPAQFPLNRVIPGWTEGLQLMSVGAKYKLYVPSELGYGANGSGEIGPHSTLIFEVELISID
ncbi:MAG: FKBP-type peptidyl-prolyl cis-trans isomerase [Acidobacteriota bacterium]|nr:FKBP-type peptidyl-prolyl cis-trans isomerase [Acidobacteriota bacterium]